MTWNVSCRNLISNNIVRLSLARGHIQRPCRQQPRHRVGDGYAEELWAGRA